MAMQYLCDQPGCDVVGTSWTDDMAGWAEIVVQDPLGSPSEPRHHERRVLCRDHANAVKLLLGIPVL